MDSPVEVLDVKPTVIASVSRHVAWQDLPREIPKMLSEVWEFLKTAPVQPAGHNVAIYHEPATDGSRVEAGVQVSGEFPNTGRVVCSQTPGGRAAHVIHIGPYSELGPAHDAVMEFCRSRGFPQGIHWEVYGDWTEDPNELRTDVYRLVDGRGSH